MLGKINNAKMNKVMATAGGALVERSKKWYIKNASIEGFCNRFTSTNHTTIRIPEMMIILVLVC